MVRASAGSRLVPDRGVGMTPARHSGVGGGGVEGVSRLDEEDEQVGGPGGDGGGASPGGKGGGGETVGVSAMSNLLPH